MQKRVTNGASVLVGLCLLVFPLFGNAQSNAGFVKGLWYDRETLIAGEQVRIYAAIRNNTGADLTGTVEFFVNEKRIERNNVAALNSRIIESWADWKPAYGTSTVRAVISRTEITTTASGTTAVSVVSALTEDIVFVDYDTDGDTIPNQTDTDDDGDGISDTKEKENGTDPLDPTSPPPETEEDSNSTQETDAPKPEEEDTGEEGDAPDGLERYLTNSSADATFERITDIVNDTRSQLDTYRETRSQRIEEERNGTTVLKKPSSEVDINSSSTASSTEAKGDGGSTIKQNEIQRIQAQAPNDADGWLATVWKFISRNLQNLYTFVLFILSSYLAHPALVQLSLLFLLLFGIYKLAQKFGKRKSE